MLPRHSYRPVLLVGSLVCTLILLAFLQYRWSGQVSEAERLRMQSSLQISVEQFRQDFTREVLSVGTALQAESDVVEASDWESLAHSQTEWLQGPTGAHLVSAVYLLRPTEKDSLLRLDAATETYLPAAIPPEMSKLIAQFQGTFDDHRPGPPRNSAWIMDGAGPYLIHVTSSRPPQAGPPPEHRAIQFIALNRDYLSTKFLPELAAHHFGGADGMVYQAQVYATGLPQAIIYSSTGTGSTGTAAHLSTAPDIDADLIEVRAPRGANSDRGPRDRSSPFRGEWKRRDGPGGLNKMPNRVPNTMPNRMPSGLQRAFNTPLLVSDGSAPWKLSVRHRSGSVAAAVQTLRWRNLTVSFAILLVLGVSMVTIVRNTQRAQRLAELQMEFVAGVSHELRTPLSVISSAAQNLTDGIVEAPGQVKQYGSLIRNESRRLSGMMEQILQFAAGQKRTPYKPVPLNVEELIEGALGLSQTELAERGFTVEKQIAPNLPPVRGESGALTQCLQNLISNAAKYSGDSRWVAIRAAFDKGWVSVTVEDHGIGIDQSELPHLFDPFYRAKAVRSAQIHGTGLGLSLARSFARDAGGDLTVESIAGQGSRFTLRLAGQPA